MSGQSGMPTAAATRATPNASASVPAAQAPAAAPMSAAPSTPAGGSGMPVPHSVQAAQNFNAQLQQYQSQPPPSAMAFAGFHDGNNNAMSNPLSVAAQLGQWQASNPGQTMPMGGQKNLAVAQQRLGNLAAADQIHADTLGQMQQSAGMMNAQASRDQQINADALSRAGSLGLQTAYNSKGVMRMFKPGQIPAGYKAYGG